MKLPIYHNLIRIQAMNAAASQGVLPIRLLPFDSRVAKQARAAET